MKRIYLMFLILSSFSLFTFTSFADINDGMMAYYPFDGNANDASGNGHHGLVYGAELFTGLDGQLNSAYFFDGDDYIYFPTVDTYQHITWAAWFRTPYDFSQANGTILEVRGAGFLYISKSNKPSCSLEPGYADWKYISSADSANDGNWHHLALTYDRQNMTFFVDGQEVGSLPDSDLINYDGPGLWLGKWWARFDRFYYGVLDDIRVYNRALSDEEIQQLYSEYSNQGPLPPIPLPEDPSLSVLFPQGGEILYKGQDYTITWNSTDVTGNVQIDLYKGGTNPEDFIIQLAANDPNDGSYPFNPPDYLDDGSDYLIGISAEGGTIWNFSNTFFTIQTAIAGQLAVTHPNGGETLTKGQDYNITWSSIGVSGNVQIDLYKGGTSPANLVLQIAAAASNTGSYQFSPPDYLDDGSDYFIGISAEVGSIWDFSNSPFTIETAYQNQPPIIDSFNLDKNCDPDPLTVCFTCAAHDPDDDIEMYIFDFGEEGVLRYSYDGTYTYTFPEFGTYQVSCIVHDELGNQSLTETSNVTLIDPSVKLYGLFVGTTSENYNGGYSARLVRDTFLNLPNFQFAILTASESISQTQIEADINNLKLIMNPNDKLFVYITAHGWTDIIGGENTSTPEDELLLVGGSTIGGDENYLTDDELYSLLKGMDDIEKWVFIDACFGGGFWGDHTESGGDLERLANISFMSTATETSKTGAFFDTNFPGKGRIGLGALAFYYTLGKNENGYFKPELYADGKISFEEISTNIENFVRDNPNFQDQIVIQMGPGDPYILTEENWTPIFEKSDDFKGALYTNLIDILVAEANGPYTGSAGSPINFSALGSNAPNGDIVLYEWDFDNDGVYDYSTSSITAIHTYSCPYDGLVRLRVTDKDAFTQTDIASVDVFDTTPPEISLSVNPYILWPPNHKMIPVSVTARAIDNCDPNPICQIKSVTSDEPENGLGDGDTAPDIEIKGPFTVNLRAERAGGEGGRTYTITVECADLTGNSSTSEIYVEVPHDKD
ncbi:LamG-like jellyroll fold domain-containing protein [Thermodesulfobacteriota bacterium]